MPIETVTITDPNHPNFGQATVVAHPEAERFPAVLSKTAFQDYAVSQLGGGATGMARFVTVMDATKVSESAAVRFAFARYEAASVFEKSNTALLTTVMVNGGCMTPAERTDLIDNWPTSAV